MAKNEVAVKPENAIARPSFLKAGARGQENVGSADLVIPRLELIQDLSPARKRDNPAYIEGAQEGMLFNNVTRELYGTEVTVVPVYFKKEWLIWKDRKSGGGFRGAFDSKAEAETAIHELKDKDGKAEDPSLFEALDTAQHFCMLLQANKPPQQIVLSMSRSKMKISRTWNSMMNLNNDDSFAHKYRVAAIGDKNSSNQDFFNLKIAPAGFVDEATYTAAEKMYEVFRAGGGKVDHTYGDDADTPVGGTAPTATGKGEF